MLTGDEGHGEELLHPFGRDEGAGRSDDLVVDLVLVASPPDPVDVLVHPLWLERAGDFPNVVLLGIATAAIERPRVGHVEQELRVQDRLLPHLLVGELGPPGVGDLDVLVLAEELLLLGAHLLEEGEGRVLLAGEELFLMEKGGEMPEPLTRSPLM